MSKLREVSITREYRKREIKVYDITNLEYGFREICILEDNSKPIFVCIANKEELLGIVTQPFLIYKRKNELKDILSALLGNRDDFDNFEVKRDHIIDTTNKNMEEIREIINKLLDRYNVTLVTIPFTVNAVVFSGKNLIEELEKEYTIFLETNIPVNIKVPINILLKVLEHFVKNYEYYKGKAIERVTKDIDHHIGNINIGYN